MKTSWPNVLSIAGLDPTGGAGILADMRTFTRADAFGSGLVTGLTVQSEHMVEAVQWTDEAWLFRQLRQLLSEQKPDAVKIGIMPSAQALLRLLDELPDDVYIIWDPILKATAGFRFMEVPSSAELKAILPRINLVTPNLAEALALARTGAAYEAGVLLSVWTPVLIKGGHDPKHPERDHLFVNGEVTELELIDDFLPSQHGTGCVLSSGIAAGLAKGKTLMDSIRLGRALVHDYLGIFPVTPQNSGT